MSGAIDAAQRSAAVRAVAAAAVAMLEADPSHDVAGVAQILGLKQWRIYAAWQEAHPDRPPRGRGCKTRSTDLSAIQEAAAAPFAAFCDVMLEHVGRRPQSAGEIFDRVLNDYGHPAARARSDEGGRRRMWRALARLVERGLVTRHGVAGSGTPCSYTRVA